MDEILHSLGGLLLNAIPTFILVIALYFYLKRIYFRPLEAVLAERYRVSEGARQAAQETLAKADAKAAEYEVALRDARNQIYREQEQYREKLRQEQAAALAEAREAASAQIDQASARLRQEADAARQGLAADTEAFAGQIVQSILHRRPV